MRAYRGGLARRVGPDNNFEQQFAENRKEQPMPGKGRPFQKGLSGNPGGRPKVLGDVQELARQMVYQALVHPEK